MRGLKRRLQVAVAVAMTAITFAAFAPVGVLTLPVAQAEPVVMFNTETLKFHSPSCRWAKKCTVHCIRITLSEALKRGGVPCKVCGGR